MISKLFDPFIENCGVVILDGAMATELEKHGADLNHPLWSAKLLTENPSLIKQVHLDYLKAGADIIKPVSRPQTIVKSLAIGNPADGFYSIQTMKQTGGWAKNPNDDEVVAGIRLLAETEGVFAETAGGVTVAAARRLVEAGRIKPSESLVLCITGHGLKTQEAVAGKCGEARVIGPHLHEFLALLDRKN